MRPTKLAFHSISLADLIAVTGGCGKKEQPAPPPCPPCPPPQQAKPQGGPEIQTSVQISGY